MTPGQQPPPPPVRIMLHWPLLSSVRMLCTSGLQANWNIPGPLVLKYARKNKEITVACKTVCPRCPSSCDR